MTINVERDFELVTLEISGNTEHPLAKKEQQKKQVSIWLFWIWIVKEKLIPPSPVVQR